jgi:hypothetical protein
MPHRTKCGAAVTEGVAFLPPGAVNLAKAAGCSVGDPTHRVALLTQVAD